MENKIKPVRVFPHYATTLKIAGVKVNKLGQEGSAVAGWQLFTDEGNEVQSGGVDINSSEYSSWNDDDSVILKLVASKLGLTLL